jgi:hypothetical protein
MAVRETRIDISVTVKSTGDSCWDPLKFSYKSKSPYFDRKGNGDIDLPDDNAPYTLVFQLLTGFVQLAHGKHVERMPVSFHLGGRPHGKDVLAIWRETDAKRKFPFMFSGPALSPVSGEEKLYTTVATTDTNQDREIYQYCLAVGVHLPDGSVLRKADDPRIKNGGVGQE